MIAPAKQLFTLRQVSALVVACTLFPTALAHAAIITRTAAFSGPEQTADISILANGTFLVNGVGQLGSQPLVVPVQQQPFQLEPNPLVISTHPSSGPVQFSVDDQTGKVVGISGLSLDLFGGVPQPYHFQTFGVDLEIGGNLASLPITAGGQIRSLQISQSENATINGDTFSVGGDTDLRLDITMSVIGIPVAQSFDYSFGAEFGAFTGDISVTPLGGADSRDVIVALDGSATFAVNEMIFRGTGQIDFSSGSLSFSGYRNAQLLATCTVDFHLQTVLTDAIVPEPTSLVSLATGLLLIGGGMALRARRSSAI